MELEQEERTYAPDGKWNGREKKRGMPRRLASNELDALWDAIQAHRAATMRWIAPAKATWRLTDDDIISTQ